MHTSEQGLALIRRFEGFSATPYRCAGGKMTIGYGHVIRPGETFQQIGIREAEELLKNDVLETERAVARLVEFPLKQCQFDALVSFAYNVGTKAFEKSTLLRLLNAQNPVVLQEFGRWVHAAGRRLEGLAARRAAEMALFGQETPIFTKL